MVIVIIPDATVVSIAIVTPGSGSLRTACSNVADFLGAKQGEQTMPLALALPSGLADFHYLT
jgi:hypothetical protein